jgi:hypothetical protein
VTKIGTATFIGILTVNFTHEKEPFNFYSFYIFQDLIDDVQNEVFGPIDLLELNEQVWLILLLKSKWMVKEMSWMGRLF